MKKTLTLVALLSSLALSSYAAETSSPSVTPEQQHEVAAYAKAQGLDKQAAWQALTPEQQQSKVNNMKEGAQAQASGGAGAGVGAGVGAGNRDGGIGAGGASQGAGGGAGTRGAGAGAGDHAGANHSAGAGAGAGTRGAGAGDHAGANHSAGAGAGAGASHGR